MWYLMHENDQKHYVKEDSKYFVTVFNYTTKDETLCVYFTPQDNAIIFSNRHWSSPTSMRFSADSLKSPQIAC